MAEPEKRQMSYAVVKREDVQYSFCKVKGGREDGLKLLSFKIETADGELLLSLGEDVAGLMQQIIGNWKESDY